MRGHRGGSERGAGRPGGTARHRPRRSGARPPSLGGAPAARGLTPRAAQAPAPPKPPAPAPPCTRAQKPAPRRLWCVAVAEPADADDRLVEEAADLIYHLYVLLAARGVDLARVEDELTARSQA